MGKRSKQYRKLIQQYGIHFGFREPYQVLLDAELLLDAARVDVLALLKNTLHAQIKPMITTCCMRHLYASQNQPLITMAKNFERRRCNHQDLEHPLSAFECVVGVVDPKGSGTNKHRYIVATQDSNMRAHLRKVKGVPLIYFKRSVMVMEPMAGTSRRATLVDERDKFRSGLKGKRVSKVLAARPGDEKLIEVGDMSENDTAEDIIDAEAGAGEDAQISQPVKRKKSKGPPGPNPLSALKSKKLAKSGNIRERVSDEAISSSKKRRRKHKSRASDQPAPTADAEVATG